MRKKKIWKVKRKPDSPSFWVIYDTRNDWIRPDCYGKRSAAEDYAEKLNREEDRT